MLEEATDLDALERLPELGETSGVVPVFRKDLHALILELRVHRKVTEEARNLIAMSGTTLDDSAYLDGLRDALELINAKGSDK